MVLLLVLLGVLGLEFAVMRTVQLTTIEDARPVMIVTVVAVILVWFLSGVDTWAPKPSWPPSAEPTMAGDARTREIATLLTSEDRKQRDQQGTLIAALVPEDAPVSASLARYAARARAGRPVAPPSRATLAAWLSELERLP